MSQKTPRSEGEEPSSGCRKVLLLNQGGRREKPINFIITTITQINACDHLTTYTGFRLIGTRLEHLWPD